MRLAGLLRAVSAFLITLLFLSASWACPPSPSWTAPEEGAGLVLAGGMDLVAERIAGPFEMPWSVGLLPDARFSSPSDRADCSM
jgi:hypothetical protein